MRCCVLAAAGDVPSLRCRHPVVLTDDCRCRVFRSQAGLILAFVGEAPVFGKDEAVITFFLFAAHRCSIGARLPVPFVVLHLSTTTTPNAAPACSAASDA